MSAGDVDLAKLLDADVRPATLAHLPVSGGDVVIATYLRHEVRAPKPIERVADCWAPNKPVILVDGRATWAEFAILRALERSGWEGRWIKNWTGGRQPCVDVGQPRDLPAVAAELLDRIHQAAPALRGAGSWDVLAWHGATFLFIESKQYRSGDRLNGNQLAWLEAALELGVSPASFVIVEYDAGRPSRSASPKRSVVAVEPTGELERLIGEISEADPADRIGYRDTMAGHGVAAVGPMIAWVEDDRLRRFAFAVLERIAATEPSAAAALAAYGARGGPDEDLARAAVERVKSRSLRTAPRPRPHSDAYVAFGSPPPAQGPCGIRNGDGTECQNPGRHPVGELWSCTTHYRSLTRRGEAR